MIPKVETAFRKKITVETKDGRALKGAEHVEVETHLVEQRKSNGEDVTMSTFPVPDYVAENAARLEKMSKEFGATLPKEMAAAINLMGHPAAGVAAMTALGFGLAGQAFGIWAGAVAGAVEVSQRLLAQLTHGGERPQSAPARLSSATVTNIARPKPVLKVVAPAAPAPKVVAKPEPVAKLVAKAEPAPKIVAKPSRPPGSLRRPSPRRKRPPRQDRRESGRQG